MFYAASKIAWFFATPSNLLVCLILAGLALNLTRFRRTGWSLAAFAAALLLAAGLSPLANWVILPLEERFPSFRDDGRPVAGVIVLGGVLQGSEALDRGQLTVNEAGERLFAMRDLARRYPDARIVFSGGGSTLIANEPAEADAVVRFADVIGIDPERLAVENRSRTTAENASETRALVRPKPGERWLLVTSAWHMPRAVGCFRKEGIPVEAYPVDYRTRGPRDVTRLFAFTSEGLRRLDAAAKEWMGLLGYRLSGRTEELFPGPRA